MKNILTFDEYNVDISLSEGLFTVDFIYMLMEEEHRLSMDCIDEGFSNAGGVSRFVPGKNDSKLNNTKIFAEGTKDFKYYVQHLPKSDIDSINLYKLGQLSIQKLLKHPEEYKLGKFTKQKFDIDEESIDKFMKRSALYIRSIIRKLKFDADVIVCPPSSSDFNERLISYVKKYLDDSVKFIPDLFLKDIRTVEVNRERAKSLGMTNEEIDKLEKDLIKWKKQYQEIYPMRVALDRLCDELMSYRAGLTVKRGRKPHDYNVLVKEILQMKDEIRKKKGEIGVGKGKEKFVKYEDNEELANILRKAGDKDYKYKKGVKTVGRARNFEIKSLDNNTRQAIENLFTLNDKKDEGNKYPGKTMEDRIKGKNVIIFDDNISSGATLDDMCLTLLKHGAKSVLPITMAIIPESSHGEHNSKPFLNRKGINESHNLQIDLDKETVTDVELFDNGDANYYFTTDEPLPDNSATMEAFLDMVDNTDDSIEWDYDGSQAFGKMRNGRTIQIDAGGDGDFTHHLVSVTIVK